jgi:hypothetical protein
MCSSSSSRMKTTAARTWSRTASPLLAAPRGVRPRSDRDLRRSQGARFPRLPGWRRMGGPLPSGQRCTPRGAASGRVTGPCGVCGVALQGGVPQAASSVRVRGGGAAGRLRSVTGCGVTLQRGSDESRRFIWRGAHGGTHGSRSILRPRSPATPPCSWRVAAWKEIAPDTPAARMSSETVPCAHRPLGIGGGALANAQPALPAPMRPCHHR